MARAFDSVALTAEFALRFFAFLRASGIKLGTQQTFESCLRVLRPGGTLSSLGVYSGKLQAGSRVLNATNGKTERTGRLLMMHANHREEIEECYAGDIVAGVGLKQTSTGDTLCAPDAPIELEQIEFPEPVIAVAIEPKTKADQEKLSESLGRLDEEDPTFQVESDDETGQTLIHGMGELHLEVLVDRLLREFSVEANVGRPQVAYRETIRKRVEKVDGKFVRQTGGRGQYGHAVINLEPAPGEGFDFVNEIKGGRIPTEYIPSVEQGIEEALQSGVKAGYPMVDVRVELIDGSYHSVDSSDMAFRQAGRIAMSEGMPQCSPVLLEPVMAVEIAVPSEATAKINGIISSRRGQILGFDARPGWPGWDLVQAQIPEAEIQNLIVELRSATAGVGTFTAKFDHLAELTGKIADHVLATRAAKAA